MKVFCKSCKFGSARCEKYCYHPSVLINKTDDYYESGENREVYSLTLMEYKNKDNNCPDYKSYKNEYTEKTIWRFFKR